MKKSGKRLGQIRTILSVMACNWSVLICFELIYKIIGISLLFPFFKYLTSLLPGLIGEDYLSQENIGKILVSPAAILILIGVVLLLGGYLYFEIIALTLYSEKGWNRETLTVRKLICMSFLKILGIFKLKRVAALSLLLIMPLSFLGTSSVFLRTVHIPEFIMTSITDNILYAGLLLAAVILINFLFFLYIFGFPTLLLTESSFRNSWKESLRLLKGKKIRTILGIFSYIIAFVSVLCIVWLAGISIVAVAVRIFDGVKEGAKTFGMTYDTFTGAWNLAAGAFISVFFCAISVTLYHRYRSENRPEPVKRVWNIKRISIRTVVVAAIIVTLIFTADTELGRQLLFTNSTDFEIVAHRAGAVFGPENTIAALNKAIEDGADMAEIDVQQLKDGTLVVLHDTNFQRTTGVNLNVWDAQYDQVKELDAGSLHSPEYAGEPVPTLEEMLGAAKGKIQLMIELKSTGHEKSLVKDTLALIEKYNMTGQCNIASLDFNLLKQVKALNPDIKATYISVLLVSRLYDLKQIDSYSVETTFLSRELVYQAHAQGKSVYGWTASSDDNIKKVLSSEADGIVTDNPLLVQYTLDTLEDSFIKKAVTELFF